MPYKIDLVQVRKLTVYCPEDDRESAEKWFDKRKDRIFKHLNMEDDCYSFNHDVHCYTVWGIIEDNSAERLYDLLHGEDDSGEGQMDEVYKVLKQEQSGDGASN